MFQHARRYASAQGCYLARLADFDRLMDALATTQASYNVKNAAVSLMLILDMFESSLNALNDETDSDALPA